ncbi:cell envelope integrity protein CreD [Flavobacterium sedimenticola]|uniref:Cell envelope integrity protein CreD n=1 Tax=Flavobacterium sedimenticola TaxID=3043286 RepID=A0ABT6XP00_9FLAO|nr:cell envelope integrity protein CreD [Flavobacterium sedimenticola]MDI9256702.1 cell envelope integrity protein CreD [Flavobacterium sedimenticola]
MENQENTHIEEKSFFQSNTAKMILVGLLTLFLLIPLFFVQDLIKERSQRKLEVVDEVATLWGSDIVFYGPILKVPYTSFENYNVTDTKTGVTTIQKKATVNYVYCFPNELNNQSVVKKNESLKRGLYQPIVFTSDMQFKGHFTKPDFAKLNIADENVLWNKASVIVKTTNLKSIKSELKIQLNDQKLSFEPQNNEKSEYSILATNLFDYKTLAPDAKINFHFNITYNGSNRINFIPIGKVTTVSIDSDWDSPSFEGSFAANDTTKTINTKGFHADWKILDINRTFSQQHVNALPDLDDYTFGVKFIETVDEYQQNERVSKYGFLVIGLTFLIFFLIQSISKINIHIFQYAMIGIALIMFYTLLISITEHSSFTTAYAISGLAIVVLITLYSVSILKNKKFPLFIGTALTVLYTFIYVIIQMEDYALLVGSIGLFLILAAVMCFSRKIDWSK